jgi:hypothetical protein
MPIGGVPIGWSESEPADSDNAGLGDDVIRSKTSNIRGGLDSEHNWPSSSGTATGYHRFGSARPYYATVSACSSDGTVARLFQTSNTSEVYALTDAQAYLIGGLGVFVSANSSIANGGITPDTKMKLAVQFGLGTCSASLGTDIITFAGSGYSGIPAVLISPKSSSLFTRPLISVFEQSKASFSARAVDSSSGASYGASASFYWFSIGTVASGVP